MQSHALCCSDPLSSQTLFLPKSKKIQGATIRSHEPKHNERGGGSIGNICPVLSAPSIALKCKKISCDSFDMKRPPVLLRCCWIGVPELKVFLWRSRNVRCLLLKSFSPNRYYPFESNRHLTWLFLFSAFLVLAEVFLLWLTYSCQGSYLWRLLSLTFPKQVARQ